MKVKDLISMLGEMHPNAEVESHVYWPTGDGGVGLVLQDLCVEEKVDLKRVFFYYKTTREEILSRDIKLSLETEE